MKTIFIIILVIVFTRVAGQPPVTNGLTLYLDANTGISGSPAVWPDLSGNGNHVTANLSLGSNPSMVSVRGRNTIRFNGSSIMATANPNIVTGTVGTIFTVATNVGNGTKVSVSSDNNLGQELLLSDNIAYHNSSPNNFVGIGHQCISSIPFDSIEIESATFRPRRILTDITHYINGISANSSSSTHGYGNPIDYFNVGRFAYVGSRIKSSIRYDSGILNLYEVLIYNRELSQAEVDSVHQYLKCKYAVLYTVCNTLPTCAPIVPRAIAWQDSCINNAINFALSNVSMLDSVNWDFGDPLSGNNTSSAFNPSHTYVLPGTYTVTALAWSIGVADTIRDTITIYNSAFVLNLGNDTTYCGGFSRVLNASQSSTATYLWQDGSSNASYLVNSAGQYWVTVSGPCDTIRDTINILVFDTLVSVNTNVSLCSGSNMLLNAYRPSATNYLWQDNSTLSTLQVFSAGTYTVEVSNSCYMVVDTFVVNGIMPINWVPLVDTTLCEGALLVVNANTAGADNYIWDNNSTDSIRVINSSGTYWVQAGNSCETIYDTVVVDYIYNPTVNLGNDTILCNTSDTLLILDAGIQDNYIWQDSTVLPIYAVTVPGIYVVQVSNGCEMAIDSITVSIAVPFSWEYIADTAACMGDTISIDIRAYNPQGYTWQWSDNVTDTIRVFEDAGDYGLIVGNGCEQVYDSIGVEYYALPEIYLGRDTTICGDDADDIFRLDAGISQFYEWQDQSTNRYFDVTKTGIYAVTVTSAEGCTKSDTIEVVKEGIYIPNAFSPNGDGINDFYRVFGLCFDNFKIQIFNRWGSKVFESNVETIAWDGRFKGVELQPGLFVYQIYYVDISGESNYKTGTIVLLR